MSDPVTSCACATFAKSNAAYDKPTRVRFIAASAPSFLLRKRRRVCHATLHPRCKRFSLGDSRGTHQQPTLHRTPRQIEYPGAGLAKQRFGIFGSDSDDELRSVYSDAYVAIDEESESSEHSCLHDAGMSGKLRSDAGSELFVECHVYALGASQT